MGADVIASGGGGIGNIASTAMDIGGALLNYGIGQKRNKSARKALEKLTAWQALTSIKAMTRH